MKLDLDIQRVINIIVKTKKTYNILYSEELLMDEWSNKGYFMINGLKYVNDLIVFYQFLRGVYCSLIR